MKQGVISVLAVGLMVSGVWAQSAQKSKNKKKDAAAVATPVATAMPKLAPPPPNTTIVEQVVARINDKIITTTDYDQAKQQMQQSLEQQAQQNGSTVTPADLTKQNKQLLATLIDNQLLIQRAQDLGLSAETQTILQLDQIRKQNHLATMEDLQNAIQSQGESYQDFKQQIQDGILQQMVIEQDVAPRISSPTPAAIKKYYDAHKSSFVTPDEVRLSEIFIKTAGTPASEQKRLRSLADQVQQRAAKGESFAKLAQHYSNAASASSGGDIGFETRSQLQPDLAKVLFALPSGGVTPVEKTSDGYLILQVTDAHQAGQESLPAASDHISQILYQQKLRPELKTYLDKLRQDAYITIAAGYVDTGAAADAGGVDLTKFERVLPSDLPKPTEKSNNSGASFGGGR
ncbi:MAG: peptidylprolyl isomerase [Terriglobales bacterium]